MVVVKHFACGTCNKRFPSGARARDRHCSDLGHAVPAFECDACPRYFKSERARFQHMHASNHFAHRCQQCPQTCPSLERLQRHEENVHQDYWACGECDLVFLAAEDLREHEAEDHWFECEECEEVWHSRTELDEHERDVHWLDCGWCPGRFPTAEVLKAHEHEDHDWYYCEDCGEGWSTQWEQDEHDELEHAWHSCDKCDERNLTAAQLAAHDEAVHRPECEWCDRRFNSVERLQKHEVKAHNCHVCHACDDTLFYSAADLAAHKIRDHKKNGERREHECTWCPFGLNNLLWIREHEREDHFYCHECRLRFFDRNGIEQHLRSRTHVGAPLGCPFCERKFTTAAGIVHHLERRACPSAPRVGIREIVQCITERELLGYFVSLLRPIDTIVPRKRWLSDWYTGSGREWRCPVCTIYSRRCYFPSHAALMKHVKVDRESPM